MPAFNLTVLSAKFYCTVSRFRSKEGDGTQSSETEKKLAPVGSNVAIVLASAFSFSNHSFFFSFSNVFIFSTLRRIISPSRSFRKICYFLRRFIFIRFSDNDARIARSLLLIQERFFSILTKSDKKTSTALYLTSRRI